MEDVYEQIRSYHSEYTPGLPLHSVYVPGQLMLFCRKYEGDSRSVRTMLDALSQGEDGPRFTQEGCGNNPQYFSQIFKKSTGMSPSAYAKMIGARQR